MSQNHHENFESDDVLSTLGFLSVKICQHKVSIAIQVVIFAVYTTIILANTYFFIKEFNMEFFSQYITIYLSILASEITYATALWNRSIVKKFEEEWAPFKFRSENAKEEMNQRIKKESTDIICFVKFHLFFSLLTGCVLIPVGKERTLPFAITFFEDYCHSYILEGIYLLAHPITIYMFVRFSYAILYFVSHVKFQLYTILDIIQDISAEYDDQSDADLLDREEYQDNVNARLLLMVTKLTELTRLASLAASDLATYFIPPLVFSGLLVGLSIMSFFYMGDSLGYWSYFQSSLWCITSLSTMIIYVYCGQVFENMSETVFDAIYNVRWTTFNKSNRKIILLTMIIFQEPMKLRFSETLSCNYELGVKIMKSLYSFAAVMARNGKGRLLIEGKSSETERSDP
ncbi:hypothetical protein Zmor_011613 [Zophobas morio]|uniref:Odorant receptor n=1 Tax=Zophobas morio TaxID=2755281 RepID=A0AA38ITF0_9CUCU|nr:hypothetical protein Zmor_011613 [Zophobas morio]